jgi:hypothetical protein
MRPGQQREHENHCQDHRKECGVTKNTNPQKTKEPDANYWYMKMRTRVCPPGDNYTNHSIWKDQIAKTETGTHINALVAIAVLVPSYGPFFASP